MFFWNGKIPSPKWSCNNKAELVFILKCFIYRLWNVLLKVQNSWFFKSCHYCISKKYKTLSLHLFIFSQKSVNLEPPSWNSTYNIEQLQIKKRIRINHIQHQIKFRHNKGCISALSQIVMTEPRRCAIAAAASSCHPPLVLGRMTADRYFPFIFKVLY